MNHILVPPKQNLILEQDSGTDIVLEPVEKWQNVKSKSTDLCESRQTYNILDVFYDAPERYAYTFQHYVFMTRYLQEIESRRENVSLRLSLIHI